MEISKFINGLNDGPSSPSLLSKSFPWNVPDDVISYFDLPSNQGHPPRDTTTLSPTQNPLDDQISMDSDLPPCSQPTSNPQDDNKFSILPLTRARKVDILYDKLRQHESPSKTFHTCAILCLLYCYNGTCQRKAVWGCFPCQVIVS